MVENQRHGRGFVVVTGTSTGLAGLVNNAGIVTPGPLKYQPLDDFRRQLEVNLPASELRQCSQRRSEPRMLGLGAPWRSA